jgi:hypothetical protein
MVLGQTEAEFNVVWEFNMAPQFPQLTAPFIAVAWHCGQVDISILLSIIY